MKNTLLLVSILIASFWSISQEGNLKSTYEINTIYGEVFGQGFGGSINYDKLVNTDRKIMNSHTFGLTYIPEVFDFGGGLYLGGHYAYNYLFGKKSHHLELGLGLSGLYTNDWGANGTFYTYLTPKIGYRYQRQTGGLFLKANVNVLIALFSFQKSTLGEMKGMNAVFFQEATDIGFPIVPWPSLGVGYTF